VPALASHDLQLAVLALQVAASLRTCSAPCIEEEAEVDTFTLPLLTTALSDTLQEIWYK
jgi:hypothetical protein